MGQSPGLHCDVCTLWGHTAPPCWGCVVLRVRVRVPSPHDVLHAPNAPQLLTWQSTGPACAVHALCSVRYGQAYPPNWAGATIDRVRFCDPVPHDLEHVDHALKPETTQCPAHGCWLQARSSFRYGHA